jgi:RNA polymerase sigma factor (sigma-70 family)
VLKMLTEENLRNAMKQLGENQYRRIYAYYFKGMTYRQIAAAEGVSDKSVRESIAGAIKKLKKFL